MNSDEPTAKSAQFFPLRMSELLQNLIELQKENKSFDESFSSADSSDDSLVETEVQKASQKSDTETTNNKREPNKENVPISSHVFTKESLHKSKNTKKLFEDTIDTKMNPEMKTKSFFKHTPDHKSMIRMKTPEQKYQTKLSKIINKQNRPIQAHENISSVPRKSNTPTLKVGIRKPLSCVTRSSAKKENNRILLKQAVARESVRCLFPNNQNSESKQTSIPETPVNSTSVPKNYMATPSHPEISLNRMTSKTNDFNPITKTSEAKSTVPETPVNRMSLPKSYTATPSFPQTSSNRATLKTVTIKDKVYMLIKKIGSGGSSTVHKVLEVGGLGEFAVKSVNLAGVDSALAESHFNEISLLKNLQGSDRVITLHDFEYFHQLRTLRVLLEVGETDFSSFLRSQAPKGLPIALIVYYWKEMLEAVQYIHSHGIIHADLKPANFLLVSGRLKLIDFGIASSVSTDATSVVRPCAAGTFSYISPEALAGGAGVYGGSPSAPIKISFRSDIWSLGCILYSMVYGKTPFGHLTNVCAKMAAIVNPNHHIEFPQTDMPWGIIQAMKMCLQYNVKERPTAAELLTIDYFATKRRQIPQDILNKLRPHLTEKEMNVLLSV